LAFLIVTASTAGVWASKAGSGIEIIMEIIPKKTKIKGFEILVPLGEQCFTLTDATRTVDIARKLRHCS
jgi:hypothetical protein